MIEWKTDDLFNSKCNVWVNTVNCEGVMGKGIALEFKKRFPKLFKEYQKWCERGDLKEGGDWIMWQNKDNMNEIFQDPIPPQFIICFATKESWRNKSKIEWIERGLKYIAEYPWSRNTSIAFPKLGCNNGGLDWITQIKPLMIKYLEPLEIKCEIYV